MACRTSLTPSPLPTAPAPSACSPPTGRVPGPGWSCTPTPAEPGTTFADMAAKLAGFGYAVLLPDVYYRPGDWAPFDMATAFSDDDERKRLMSMIGSVTPVKMATTLRRSSTTWPVAPKSAATRFGTTGYCMGGRTSMVVAGRASSGPGRRCGVFPRRRAGHRRRRQPASAGRPDSGRRLCGRCGERRVVHGRAGRAARESPDGGRRRAQDRDLSRRARVRRAGQPRPMTPPPPSGIGRRRGSSSRRTWRRIDLARSDQPLHEVGIARALHLDARRGVVDLAQVVGASARHRPLRGFPRGGAAASAGDRHDPRLLREQPGQSDLAGRRALAGCDRLE